MASASRLCVLPRRERARWRKAGGEGGIESTSFTETKEFCDAARPSRQNNTSRELSEHLPEPCRRDPHDSAENLGEVALVYETNRFCNLTDRELGAPEKLLGTINPASQGVLVWAYPGALFEEFAKIMRTHSRELP